MIRLLTCHAVEIDAGAGKRLSSVSPPRMSRAKSFEQSELDEQALPNTLVICLAPLCPPAARCGGTLVCTSTVSPRVRRCHARHERSRHLRRYQLARAAMSLVHVHQAGRSAPPRGASPARAERDRASSWRRTASAPTKRTANTEGVRNSRLSSCLADAPRGVHSPPALPRKLRRAVRCDPTTESITVVTL